MSKDLLCIGAREATGFNYFCGTYISPPLSYPYSQQNNRGAGSGHGGFYRRRRWYWPVLATFETGEGVEMNKEMRRFALVVLPVVAIIFLAAPQ